MKISKILLICGFLCICNTALAQNTLLNQLIGSYTRAYPAITTRAGATLGVTKINGTVSVKGFSNSTALELTCESAKLKSKLNLRLQGAQTLYPENSKVKLTTSGSSLYFTAIANAVFQQSATLSATGEKSIATVSTSTKFTKYYAGTVPLANVSVNNVSLYFPESKTTCYLPRTKSFSLAR